MSLPLQFAIFVILGILVIYLIFYKIVIKFGKKFIKYFKNIKDELEREE